MNPHPFIQRKRPSLSTTYDAHDPYLLEGILPYVDFIEITPDSIFRRRNGVSEIQPDILKDLLGVSRDVRFLVHGVGLSIGSWEGYDASYLDNLDLLLPHIDCAWHSEHLGYVKVGGDNLNTMLAVPRTDAMLELLIPRIKSIQSKYDMPFLLEHIVHLLPDYQPEYSDAGFLNLLTAETGCGLILDLYNLECDAHNYGFDIESFLAELDLSAVREIHIAGGADYMGYKLDIHSGKVADSTLNWTRQALAHTPNAEAVTYEILPEAVRLHGAQFVIDELARISSFFNFKKHGHQNPPGNSAAADQIAAVLCAA